MIGEQGFGVYEIRKLVEAGSEQIDKRAAEIRAQLEQLLAQQDVALYVESLKDRADIKRSPSRLGGSRQQ